MSDDKQGQWADVAKIIAENVPVKQVYEDALQPALQPLGEGLGEAVKLATLPLLAMGNASRWALPRIQRWISRRLNGIPTESLQAPKMSIVGPVLSGAVSNHDTPHLRRMFLELLAKSMIKDEASLVHPSFAETLRQLDSRDAHLLKGLSTARLWPVVEVKPVMDKSWSYLDVTHIFPDFEGDEHLASVAVLERLGLVAFSRNETLASKGAYEPLMAEAQEWFSKGVADGSFHRVSDDENASFSLECKRTVFSWTPYGFALAAACIVSDDCEEGIWTFDPPRGEDDGWTW